MKKILFAVSCFLFSAALCIPVNAADMGITPENFISTYEQHAKSLEISNTVRPILIGKMNNTVSYGLGEGSTTLRLRLSADAPDTIEAVFVNSHEPKTEQEAARYVVAHILALAAATPNMDGDTRGVLINRLRLTTEAFSGKFESPTQHADNKVFSSKNTGTSLLTTIIAE